MRALHLLSISTLALLLACTPKVTEETTATTQKPGKPAVSADPCAKFSDSRAGEAALDAHVIYRDYIRAKRYAEAIPYWRQAFTAAPAADGKRQTHFEDGIEIYDHLLNQATSASQKQTYLDSIFYMYDRMGQCYNEYGPGYIDGRKAFDLYYKYRDLTDNQTIFNHFRRILDAQGLDAPAFVINPFTALLVEMFTKEEIRRDVAVRYAKLILDICEAHQDDQEEGWPIVVNYAPQRMDVFETVRGFFECDYYVHKYFEGVDLETTDCEELFSIRTRLLWGGCDPEGEEIAALERAYQRKCVVTPTGNPLLTQARDALEEGRYQDAIDHYVEYVEKQSDPDRLAKYNLRVGKIYYAHLKNFTRAREYALKALEHKPDWGEPYIMIGKLYASSGPLCGPGRGWDSQIVTWPAIDKFMQAKRVDPSVSAEANKWINYYSRYMPSIEDIFQRQLAEGDTFRVGCWIQENTTIRAAPRS
ncbi:MAG: tetratricopeptide repeat protein [Saprospiraceae bacterium]|nr:tetratricopeptide repeat protein [Saprospiraceae bacterium]